MKVIDRTPLLDPQGNINAIARVQGTLTYGLNWFPELEAQKKIINQLDRLLDKGFVMIRNLNLPDSEIFIPIILIGPGSFNVIFVTPVKGHFQVKGVEWNTLSDKGDATPAKRNPIDLLVKLTRAVQKYLQIHKINVSVPIEPVLIASDPGANIESSQPAVRVVRSDAVKPFAASLNSASPILRAEQALALADLIIEPQPLVEKKTAPPSAQTEKPLSRAQAIFKASSEGASQPQTLQSLPKASPAKPAPSQPARKKRTGITGIQMLILAAMGLLGCCVMGGLAYFLFFLN